MFDSPSGGCSILKVYRTKCWSLLRGPDRPLQPPSPPLRPPAICYTCQGENEKSVERCRKVWVHAFELRTCLVSFRDVLSGASRDQSSISKGSRSLAQQSERVKVKCFFVPVVKFIRNLCLSRSALGNSYPTSPLRFVFERGNEYHCSVSYFHLWWLCFVFKFFFFGFLCARTL